MIQEKNEIAPPGAIHMKQFATHDLALAATLLFEKCYLLDVDRSGLQVEFVFEETDQVRDIVAKYWRDQLPYPAQGLFASLRKAKHILYDFQR